MSGTDSGSARVEKRCQFLKMARRLLRLIKKESSIAIFAAISSIILVIVVIILMSFIEYQSRLLRSQANTPTAEIVNALVATYEIEAAGHKYKEISENYRRLSLEAQGSAIEVKYHIDILCSFFDAAPGSDLTGRDAYAVSRRIRKCHYFLGKLPFDGTTSPGTLTVPAKAGPAMGRTSYQGRLMLAEQMRRNFIAAMGESAEHSLKGYGPALNERLLSIADANWRRAVKLDPEIDALRRMMFEQCSLMEQTITTTRMLYGAANACPSNWRVLLGDKGLEKTAGVCVGIPSLSSGPGATPSDTSPTPDGKTPSDVKEPTKQPTSAATHVFIQQPGWQDDAGARVDPAEQQRQFGLVTHFRLFHDIASGLAKSLILSPPDYLAQWLLFFGGALGAMVNILFINVNPLKTLNWSQILLGPAQGIVCAIIVFILFRSGFVVIPIKVRPPI